MAFLRGAFCYRTSGLWNTIGARRWSTIVPEALKFSKEIQQARTEGSPILALESTIITHGMPYPQNLETALQVEKIVRAQGAIPATIAILGGQLTIGLTEDQLRYLAQAKGVVKASRRDLAAISAAKADGATTVAGTILAAQLADIDVFATGGIGGVHRNGENTLDVSADLTELGRNRTLVVCSGVKSILDIGRTLEYLETQGVCVCAFGESHDFPAFYTRRSGTHRAPYSVSTALHAARLLHASHMLCLNSGIVIAVPVPEPYAMDENIIETAITQALQEAETKGVRGKEVTPFLLAAVAEATTGASLDTNIALIKNNAKVGADIAVEFNRLKNSENVARKSNSSASERNVSSFGHNPVDFTRGIHTTTCNVTEKFCGAKVNTGNCESGPIVVIGGANVDRTYKVTESNIKLDGSTHPCFSVQCGGGVGRNIGEALWRLRGPGAVHLITAVGDDPDGEYLTKLTPELLVDGSVVTGLRTPSYAALLDSRGECVLGLGDMTYNQITIEMVNKNRKLLESASMVVIDGNPPQETVDHIMLLCQTLHKPVFFEPTDRRKAIKPFLNKHQISFATPNCAELISIAHTIQQDLDRKIILPQNTDEILKLCMVVSDFVSCIIVTLGETGIIIFENKVKLQARLYTIEKLQQIINVSGAGDCFASGFIHGMLSGLEEEYCIAMGLHTAREALYSETTVPLQFKNVNLKKAKYIKLI